MVHTVYSVREMLKLSIITSRYLFFYRGVLADVMGTDNVLVTASSLSMLTSPSANASNILHRILSLFSCAGGTRFTRLLGDEITSAAIIFRQLRRQYY